MQKKEVELLMQPKKQGRQLFSSHASSRQFVLDTLKQPLQIFLLNVFRIVRKQK